MDSLTQIVLGAAVGEAIMGKKAGNKAALWGGIMGTIPDLDVLANPFLSELGSLVFHRSFTHSITFSVLFAPIFAWLIFSVIYRKKQGTQKDWLKLTFWALFTHPLLDCFTNWGTQLFYPFSDYRVSLNSIFIVDLVYTLPFGICLLIALFLKRENPWRQRWNTAGLVFSTLLLGMTLVNQASARAAFKILLHERGSSVERMTVQPMPFNMLWYCVAEEPSGYRIGSHSVLSDPSDIQFQYIPKHRELTDSLTNTYVLDKLAWFSNGYYTLEKYKKDTLLFHDLRFGLLSLDADSTRPPAFTFSIKVPTKSGDIFRVPPPSDFGGKELKVFFKTFWNRTWAIRRD